MLRYQPEVGPGLDSPLVRYLTLPVVPVQLGFDPRLQFLHADDATGAIEAAVANPVRGPVNVAPDGSISLSRALRLLRPPAPSRCRPRCSGALIARARLAARRRRACSATGSGCCASAAGSTTAACVEEVGYEPRYDAAGAIGDLAAEAAGRRIGPACIRRRRRPARAARGARAMSGPRAQTLAPEAIADFLRERARRGRGGLDPLGRRTARRPARCRRGCARRSS